MAVAYRQPGSAKFKRRALAMGILRTGGASLGEATLQDIRFGLRMLRKNFGFTAVAVLMLALGIGANTAIFSIVYGVLLRPLPYPEQDRLVTLSEGSKQVPGMSISYPNFLDWRARQTCFTAIGVSRGQTFNYLGISGAERVRGMVASHDLYAALGVPALRGRLFRAEDDQAGAERTVLLGESYWQRSFGGRDSALGEKIQLSGDSYTIIGVVPDAVHHSLGSADLSVPLGLCLGYATQHILTFDFELAGPAYGQPGQRLSLIERGLEKLAAMPSVRNAALVNPLPLRGGNQSTYYVEGTTVPGPGQAPSAERIQVSADYFATLGIRLMAGRTFGAQDVASSPRAAIVDTMFVEKYFPGQNPLGKRFVYGETPPTRKRTGCRLSASSATSEISDRGRRRASRFTWRLRKTRR
jgi:hypothetical protein